MELSVVALGHVHEQDLLALTPHCNRIEQLVLDIHPRHPLGRHRAEFNRAVDAATADWILIIREPESIGEALAAEIETAVREAKAWGFRIRTLPIYAGRPLRLQAGDGELRLLHKRHYLRFASNGLWEEPMVQGTVIRLNSPFQALTFPSFDAHREYLGRNARPLPAVRHVLRFLREVLARRSADRNTLRYIWTEAGFDRE